VLGGLHHGLQLDAAVVCRRRRRGDDVGDLLVNARQFRRQIGLAIVDQLNSRVDFHAQFGDAAIDEAAEVVDLRTGAGTHQRFEAVGHG
jgi:hypothetical protein